MFLSYGRRNEASRRRDRNLWCQQHCREIPELDAGSDVHACIGYRERFRDCDESVCLDSLVDGDIDVWDGDRLFPVYEQEGDQAPMRVYATTLFSLAFTSVLFMVFVFSALTPVSNFWDMVRT